MGGQEFEPSIHEEWWWLRKDTPGVLTLLPVTETGTVNVTNNSTAITFSSAPAVSVAGYFLKITGLADVFRIATHTAAAGAATLDAVYTGTTNATASYKLMKLEYDLASDVLRILSPMRSYQDARYKIDGMDLTQLEDQWPLTETQSGVPRAFAHISETKVRFSHYGGTTSTDLIRVEYDYLYRPADLTDSASEEPKVPRQYRKVLADLGLFYLFMDKNDNRADAIALMAKAGIKAMKRENDTRWARMGRELGRIVPRQEEISAYRRGPLRTSGGLIIG